MLHMYHLGGLERERGRLRGRHDRLPRRRDPRAQRAAAARVELRQHVVEQEQRAHGQQLGLGQDQGEHREPLLALRAEPAQIAVAARHQDVVEVRARGRSSPRSRSSGSRASSCSTVGASAS